MNILRLTYVIRNPATTCVIRARCLSTQTTNHAQLAEVGKLILPNEKEEYKAGQFFLHKIFSYRGVILFPWNAELYERIPKDNLTQTPAATEPPATVATGPATSTTSTANTITDTDEVHEAVTRTPLSSYRKRSKDVETTTISKVSDSDKTAYMDKHITNKSNNQSQVSITNTKFYQVLIDSRDCPYVRAQTEGVTFLGKKNSNKNIYSVPGLDYVAHDDIIPYSISPNERRPLRHELFEKFLAAVPGTKRYEATETCYVWQLKNHPFLELSEVHRETTENIRVTVIPFYMGSRKESNKKLYWWRYSIRLENLGDVEVKLRERNWRIFSLSGTLETVRGRGVVGQEPVLNSRLPAFQYSSHVNLQASSGHMWGTFLMEREDGSTFDVRIPPFCLDSEVRSDTEDSDNEF